MSVGINGGIRLTFVVNIAKLEPTMIRAKDMPATAELAKAPYEFVKLIVSGIFSLVLRVVTAYYRRQHCKIVKAAAGKVSECKL